MHDPLVFTVGCNLHYDCTNYIWSGDNCSQIHSSKLFELTNLAWKIRYKAWKDLDLNIIAPSRWLYDCAIEAMQWSGAVLNNFYIL